MRGSLVAPLFPAVLVILPKLPEERLCSRIAEVGVVQEVEVLCAELEVDPFGEVEVALEAGVPIGVAGADEEFLMTLP